MVSIRTSVLADRGRPNGPEYRRDDQTGALRWYLYDGLGSVLGVGATGLAVGTSSVAAGTSLAEAATAVACCFSAKQVSLAVAAWAVGLGVIGGGSSGLCAAAVYMYGRKFQVSALLKSLEGEAQ
jgi:hypothetical protein